MIQKPLDKPNWFFWFATTAEILLALSLPAVAWALTKVVDHEARIATIEGNRFTAQDGKDIQRELSNIWREISAFPREIPPKWFEERVDRIDRNQHTLLEAVRDIDKRLSVLEVPPS